MVGEKAPTNIRPGRPSSLSAVRGDLNREQHFNNPRGKAEINTVENDEKFMPVSVLHPGVFVPTPEVLEQYGDRFEGRDYIENINVPKEPPTNLGGQVGLQDKVEIKQFEANYSAKNRVGNPEEYFNDGRPTYTTKKERNDISSSDPSGEWMIRPGRPSSLSAVTNVGKINVVEEKKATGQKKGRRPLLNIFKGRGKKEEDLISVTGTKPIDQAEAPVGVVETPRQSNTNWREHIDQDGFINDTVKQVAATETSVASEEVETSQVSEAPQFEPTIEEKPLPEVDFDKTVKTASVVEQQPVSEQQPIFEQQPEPVPERQPVPETTVSAPEQQPAPEQQSAPETAPVPNREKAKARGYKTLSSLGDIHLMTSAGLSEAEAKKEAASVAYHAMHMYDEKIKAEREAKSAAIEEKGGLLNKITHGKILGRVSLADFAQGFVDNTIGAVKRTKAIRRYYETALEAIQSSGRRTAGGEVIDQLFGKVPDITNGVSETDRAMVERALQVKRAEEAGVYDFDQGVEIRERAPDNELTSAMKKFAREVAGYDMNLKPGSGASEAEIAQENARRAQARVEITEALKKSLGNTANNAAEVVELLEKNLSGIMREELQDPTKHDMAVKQIDRYIEKRFHVDKFKVKDSGLNVNEESYGKLSEKLAISSGVLLGAAVAVGGSYATGLTKSWVIQRITNSQVVMAAMKVGIATNLGFARGFFKEMQEQKKDNVDMALGYERASNRVNKKADYGAMMMNVNDVVRSLKGRTDLLIDKEGKVDEGARRSLIDEIGGIMARNQLQRERAVNLFIYGGRDKVERGKADMYAAINDAIERLKATGMGVPNVGEQILHSRDQWLETLRRGYNDVKKAQVRERLKRGGKNAAAAGISAAAAVFVVDAMRGGKLQQEISDLAKGRKKFNGLNVVDVNEAPAGAAAVTKEAAERTAQGKNNPANNKKVQSNGAVDENRPGGKGQNVEQPSKGAGNTGNTRPGTTGNTENAKPGTTGNTGNTRPGTTGNGGNVEAPKGQTEEIIGQPKAEKELNINKVNWNKSQQLTSMERMELDKDTGLWKVHVDGNIPEGAKLYVSPNGKDVLSFEIHNGEAQVPASLINSSKVASGGSANFFGVARVANVDSNGDLISYTTNVGKMLSDEDFAKSNIDSYFSSVSGGNGAGASISGNQRPTWGGL